MSGADYITFKMVCVAWACMPYRHHNIFMDSSMKQKHLIYLDDQVTGSWLACFILKIRTGNGLHTGMLDADPCALTPLQLLPPLRRADLRGKSGPLHRPLAVSLLPSVFSNKSMWLGLNSSNTKVGCIWPALVFCFLLFVATEWCWVGKGRIGDETWVGMARRVSGLLG